MSERWRDVFDWVGLYRVSDAGRVASVLRTVRRKDGTTQRFQSKLLAQPLNSKGYPCVRLSAVDRRAMPPVHRLVALAFLGLPPQGKPEVNHIDGNKRNNRLENLEWVSSRENRTHAWRIGLRTREHLPIKRGVEQGRAKLTPERVVEARRRRAAGETLRGLAREFGVNHKTLACAISGRTWALPAPPMVGCADHASLAPAVTRPSHERAPEVRKGRVMSNKTPLVIYHADCWDGFCAAWVARTALGKIEAVPAHYGTPPPDVAGREVYVVDFSYSFDVMAEMASRSAAFTVLDHHKTAERAIADLEAMFITHNMAGRARYGVEKSGARMAWEFFGFIGGWEGMPSPWLVDYTEDRDLWRHALEGTQEINAALRSYPLDFDLWDQFAQKDPRSTFFYEGAAIRRRERQIVEDHVRHARLMDFALMAGGPSACELRVPIVNATTLFSEIAGELAKGHPFAACYFDRHDGKRQWSLRSAPDGVDVSEIAKAYGGGGHKHAAGFESQL